MSIDPTKPMYDADGREWVALRRPDGSVWKTAMGYMYVVMSGDHGHSALVNSAGHCSYVQLSNTKPQKPQKDWSAETVVYCKGEPREPSTQSLKVRAGYRNGKPFVEVLND